MISSFVCTDSRSLFRTSRRYLLPSNDHLQGERGFIGDVRDAQHQVADDLGDVRDAAAFHTAQSDDAGVLVGMLSLSAARRSNAGGLSDWTGAAPSIALMAFALGSSRA